MRRSSAWMRWGAVLFAATAIFLASSRAVPAGLVPPIPQSDKLAHAAGYALFAVLIFRAVHGDPSRAVEATALVVGVILASAYGISDEFHQSFVPSRSCDVFDWLADTGGATAAALAWPWLTRKLPILR